MQTQRLVKRLPVNLTEEERVAFGQQLSRLVNDATAAKESRKAANAEWNQKVSEIEVQMQTTAQCIGTATEVRDVECEEKFDFGRGVVYLVRTDTGEEVEKRPMQEWERQKRFDGLLDDDAAALDDRFKSLEPLDPESPEPETPPADEPAEE